MELRVGAKRHVCFAYIVMSKTGSKQKRVIQSDQDVKVCGNICFFVWRMDELLCMIHLSSLFSMDVDYLSLFFLFDMPCGHVAYLLWVCIFLFFLTCLLSMWHTFFGYASFVSFCIAHILDGRFREKESWYVMEFYYVGG